MHVSVSKGGWGWREYSEPECFPVKSVSHPQCHRTCHMLAHYVSDTDTKEEEKMTWSFQNRWGIRELQKDRKQNPVYCFYSREFIFKGLWNMCFEEERRHFASSEIQLFPAPCPVAFWLIVITCYLGLGPTASIRAGWGSRSFPLIPQGVGKCLPYWL